MIHFFERELGRFGDGDALKSRDRRVSARFAGATLRTAGVRGGMPL
jgi:hypothetical protein